MRNCGCPPRQHCTCVMPPAPPTIAVPRTAACRSPNPDCLFPDPDCLPIWVGAGKGSRLPSTAAEAEAVRLKECKKGEVRSR